MSKLYYLSILLTLMKIYNPNSIIIAAPSQEEIIQGTKIVNVTVSSIDVLKQHYSFAQYFDFNQTCPCYNGTVAEFCIMCKIKNPPKNLLGVFFDESTRDDEDDKYSLEELKYMANNSANMFIFWKYEEK
ncbi:effector protein ['Planchonia careya' phytoplasma]|nr:effector protein ['Planchonia careya' phytoplasma]MDO8030099.1 effector protein ['Planchonia careya' phytoplasma]